MVQNSKQYGATKNQRKSSFKQKAHFNAIMYIALYTTQRMWIIKLINAWYEVWGKIHYTTPLPAAHDTYMSESWKTFGPMN